MSMLRGQADVSPQVPMPIDNVDMVVSVTDVSAETLTWFFVSSSAWVSATGEVAGTLVQGKLLYSGVLNASKSAIGNYNSTTVVLGASTRLDTLVSIPEEVLSKMQVMSPTDQKATALLYLTTNGYYAIDHRRGQIWGRPKAVVADDSVSYSVRLAAASSVAVTSVVPGTGATNLGKAEDAAHTTGDTGVAILAKRTDTAASSAGTDGDYATVNQDSLGHVWTREGYAPGYEDNTVGVAKTEQRFSYANITSATTTTVKSGSGFLHAVNVNTTAAGTITIYDNTAGSGTKIATLKASVGEQTFEFNVSFGTGLTIVTAAASDLTVSYR